jgi:hypothetical protein
VNYGKIRLFFLSIKIGTLSTQTGVDINILLSSKENGATITEDALLVSAFLIK